MNNAPGRGCACCGFMPPFVMEQLLDSANPEIRRTALNTIRADEKERTLRGTPQRFGMLGRLRSRRGCRREIYDLEHGWNSTPAKGETPARTEKQGPTGIDDVDRAFDNAGIVYDFYKEELGRDSLDGDGYGLHARVRFGRGVINAYWDGYRMIYGAGDGHFFLSSTRSLSIAAHEMTHGVLNFTSNLAYEGETGAVNETFCDVMGLVISHWHAHRIGTNADWTIGSEIFGEGLREIPGVLRGVRIFTEEPAFSHPELGHDLQKKHYSYFFHTGNEDDHGGVHVNSGIGNLAFFLAAQDIGGDVWDKPMRIWYQAFTVGLRPGRRRPKDPIQVTYAAAASATVVAARDLYGETEARKVAAAWEAVGVRPTAES